MNHYLSQVINPVVTSLNSTDPVEATSSVIQVIISTLLLVASIYFLVYFLLGGISFITSEGDKNNIEVAKKQLTYAFIGLCVTFSVYAVMNVLGRVFGISGLENSILNIPHL